MYPLGLRRHDCDAQRMIAALCDEFSCRELARLCGVSDRTVRRWRDGTDWPTREAMATMLDALFPQSDGWAPIYSPDMAIDGNTRLAGVGEYSIRSSRGEYHDHDCADD